MDTVPVGARPPGENLFSFQLWLTNLRPPLNLRCKLAWRLLPEYFFLLSFSLFLSVFLRLLLLLLLRNAKGVAFAKNQSCLQLCEIRHGLPGSKNELFIYISEIIGSGERFWCIG